MKTNNPQILTVAEHILLHQVYENLVGKGLMLTTIEYEEFLEAVV